MPGRKLPRGEEIAGIEERSRESECAHEIVDPHVSNDPAIKKVRSICDSHRRNDICFDRCLLSAKPVGRGVGRSTWIN